MNLVPRGFLYQNHTEKGRTKGAGGPGGQDPPFLGPLNFTMREKRYMLVNANAQCSSTKIHHGCRMGQTFQNSENNRNTISHTDQAMHAC